MGMLHAGSINTPRNSPCSTSSFLSDNYNLPGNNYRELETAAVLSLFVSPRHYPRYVCPTIFVLLGTVPPRSGRIITPTDSTNSSSPTCEVGNNAFTASPGPASERK